MTTVSNESSEHGKYSHYNLITLQPLNTYPLKKMKSKVVLVQKLWRSNWSHVRQFLAEKLFSEKVIDPVWLSCDVTHPRDCLMHLDGGLFPLKIFVSVNSFRKPTGLRASPPCHQDVTHSPDPIGTHIDCEKLLIADQPIARNFKSNSGSHSLLHQFKTSKSEVSWSSFPLFQMQIKQQMVRIPLSRMIA